MNKGYVRGTAARWIFYCQVAALNRLTFSSVKNTINSFERKMLESHANGQQDFWMSSSSGSPGSALYRSHATFLLHVAPCSQSDDTAVWARPSPLQRGVPSGLQHLSHPPQHGPALHTLRGQVGRVLTCCRSVTDLWPPCEQEAREKRASPSGRISQRERGLELHYSIEWF